MSYFTHDQARSPAYHWGEDDQTGWIGVVARAMHLFATVTPEQLLKGGRSAYFDAMAGAPLENSKDQTNP